MFTRTTTHRIAAAVVLAAAFSLVLCLSACAGPGGGSEPEPAKLTFLDMYEKYGTESWCPIGSDGSFMRVDTNPSDKDDESYYYILDPSFAAAMEFIQQTNTDLGFSAALWQKMKETTALQGRQQDENDLYKVSWTYHPDKGLEVMYELK